MALVYAHRGLHVTERENTVDAFTSAVALGVDGVELDVRRTADGHLVVHHDAVIDGVAISEAAYVDLPDYVPTFADAMAACRGINVNVEIKNIRHETEPSYDDSGDFARHVLEDLYRFELATTSLISCFDLATCALIRKLDPSIGVGWLLEWSVELSGAMDRAKDLGAVTDRGRLREPLLAGTVRADAARGPAGRHVTPYRRSDPWPTPT